VFAGAVRARVHIERVVKPEAKAEIYVSSADGSGLRQVKSRDGDGSPTLAPDGKISAADVRRIPLREGRLRGLLERLLPAVAAPAIGRVPPAELDADATLEDLARKRPRVRAGLPRGVPVVQVEELAVHIEQVLAVVEEEGRQAARADLFK